jgi:hypothetical protein
LQASVDGGRDRIVKVLGPEQDERVRAAQLEYDLLQVAPGDLGDGRARPLGAGQRNAPNPRIGEDLGDLLVRGEDRLIGALGEAGIPEHGPYGIGRHRALGGRLQQDRVPDDQVRTGETRHLVEGEVPRHDPEQRAHRGLANQGRALPSQQCDGLVGEEVLRVVGVVAIDRVAEVDLAEGLLDRLAHLPHRDLGKLLPALSVQLGDPLDQRGPLGHGCSGGPVPMGLVGLRDRCAEITVRDLRILLDLFAGGRIDDRVKTHVLSSLTLPSVGLGNLRHRLLRTSRK